MVKIKICGLTSLADALKAVEFGAEAVGFVLAPSPRQIKPAQLKKISLALPPLVSRVGVFANADISLIKDILTQGLLDYIQLHGDEDMEYCRSLPLPKVIKAVRLKSESDLENLKLFQEVGAILVDSFVEGKRGGTGKTANWPLAIKAKMIGPPLILSGGLTPPNIREAIIKVKPYAVDVSSGVEKSPGRKDYRQLKIFIQRAREV